MTDTAPPSLTRSPEFQDFIWKLVESLGGVQDPVWVPGATSDGTAYAQAKRDMCWNLISLFHPDIWHSIMKRHQQEETDDDGREPTGYQHRIYDGG